MLSLPIPNIDVILVFLRIFIFLNFSVVYTTYLLDNSSKPSSINFTSFSKSTSINLLFFISKEYISKSLITLDSNSMSLRTREFASK